MGPILGGPDLDKWGLATIMGYNTYGNRFTDLSFLLQMTGRKGRVVSNDDGSISYESRSELDVPVEILNLTEKQRFMDGEKVRPVLGREGKGEAFSSKTIGFTLVSRSVTTKLKNTIWKLFDHLYFGVVYSVFLNYS